MSEESSTPMSAKYAVIFSSTRSSDALDGYEQMAHAMLELAARQVGFMGVESVRDASGNGITVSYWASLDAIRDWKNDPAHQEAQALGRSRWYQCFKVQICKIESASEYVSCWKED